MRVVTYLMTFSEIIVLTFSHMQCHSNRTGMVKSRRERRYIVFPKSSTFVLTLTGLKAIQVNEPSNWNLDLEFDMIWPIPQNEALKPRKHKMRKKYSPLRRHKRDLYANVEMSINRLGLPGRDCMLRTICESRKFLRPAGISFVHDILRVVLSHSKYSTKELDMYDIAYHSAESCEIKYKCPISLLQLFLQNEFEDE